MSSGFQLRERIHFCKEMSLRDWRQALTTPPVYRVGNSTLRIQTHFVCLTAALGLLVLGLWYTISPPHRIHKSFLSVKHIGSYAVEKMPVYAPLIKETYNASYPLTPPINSKEGIIFRIGLVSDLDTDSKSTNERSTWISYYKKGYLIWNSRRRIVSLKWDAEQPAVLRSTLSQAGRGMELSELLVFNGRLYTFDDRTGVIYEIEGSKVIPWVMLSNGNGRNSKGFKAEWATVKDRMMFVGGLGKEWTTPAGELVSYDPMWTKTVSPSGEVGHHDWQIRYERLRSSVGVEFPGYMIHEAASWSDYHNKWFFLPRRMSNNQYHEDTDPYQGTNLILTADSNFTNIKVTRVGEIVPTRGFSSFKFIPGTKDEVIVALKSEELKEGAATYIMVFTIRGDILLPETKVADHKYEGLEFV